jgi:hypothetical protein
VATGDIRILRVIARLNVGGAGAIERALDQPPDPWGGRAAVAWAEQLSVDPTFDARIEPAHLVAEVIDEIYRQNVSD